MRGLKPNMRLPKNPVSKAPKVPAWFNEHATAEWRRIWPELLKRKTVTEADLGSVENYCVAMGQVRQMQVLLNKTSSILINKEKGTARANPAVKIQSDAMTRARLLAAELGLTPVSRSRPSIRDDSEAMENEFDI